MPVGGADRLLLSEHIAFQDLLALGRFARFPDDDLTLAALLRSPFCDVDEDRLFDLAYGRGGSLWAALQRARRRAAGVGRGGAASSAWARREAERARAVRLLRPRAGAGSTSAGRSMQRAPARPGWAARPRTRSTPSWPRRWRPSGAACIDLERFVAEMAASEIEVKREQEDPERQGEGEVRVMTVHGAKGLEAPIVILPDTTTRATAQGGPLLATRGRRLPLGAAQGRRLPGLRRRPAPSASGPATTSRCACSTSP